MASRAWKFIILTALLAFAPVAGALAAEAAAPVDQGPTDVELPAMLAPMIIANRLESYAYITVALTPATRDKVFLIREKVPFLQDAFLREVNKATIVKADDPRAVDAPALKLRLMARLNQILPRGTVSDLKFEQIVLTPIQP